MTGDRRVDVVLCADDFAMTEGVARGIIELAGMGRISATSVMTNAPAWKDTASDLSRFGGGIGCGLHVNLTAGKALAEMPAFAPAGRLPDLPRVLRAAFTRTLPLAEIEMEIGRQLDAFAERFGRMPDFVDGHQHVHVLPGIRAALLRRLAAAGLAGKAWLRDPGDRLASVLSRARCVPKALLVGGFAAGFARDAGIAGFAVNRGFSGFSDFSADGDTAADFARFFKSLGTRPVVMCHPGYVAGTEADDLDEVTESRMREQAFLSSASFAELLSACRVRLVPNPR